MGCVVSDKYATAVCHYCFRPLPLLTAMQVKCKGGGGSCGVVYCQQQCADADVQHRPGGGECQVLQAWEAQAKATGKPISTRGLRLFMRLVYAYGADEGLAQLAEMLEGDHGAEADAKMCGMAGAVNRFVLEEARMPKARLAKLISQAQHNTHGIVDLDGHNLGHGLYPLASFFNHSCSPNAVVSFSGQTLVVRALRDIPAEEEVTIAYVELYAPREYRRLQLQAKKKFVCQCRRCVSPAEGEARISAGPPSLASDAREGWDRALILFHQEKFHEAFEALQGVVRMTDGKLGYDHWVRRLLRYPCTHRARARARAHTHTHTHCT